MDEIDEFHGNDSSITLGNEALDFIEHLREQYGDKFTLGTVAIIADVEIHGDDDTYTIMEFSCTDVRRWAQAGFFDAARRSAIASVEEIDLDN